MTRFWEIGVGVIGGRPNYLLALRMITIVLTLRISTPNCNACHPEAKLRDLTLNPISSRNEFQPALFYQPAYQGKELYQLSRDRSFSWKSFLLC